MLLYCGIEHEPLLHPLRQRGQFQRYGFVFPDPNLHHRSERYTLRRGYDCDFPIHDSITGSIRLLADRRQWIDEHCDGHWQPKPGHWVDYDRKQLLQLSYYSSAATTGANSYDRKQLLQLSYYSSAATTGANIYLATIELV